MYPLVDYSQLVAQSLARLVFIIDLSGVSISIADDWGLARRCVDHKNISSFLEEEEEESHSATFPSLTLLLLHLRDRSCSSTDQQAKISQIEGYFYLSSPLLFMHTVLPPTFFFFFFLKGRWKKKVENEEGRKKKRELVSYFSMRLIHPPSFRQTQRSKILLQCPSQCVYRKQTEMDQSGSSSRSRRRRRR